MNWMVLSFGLVLICVALLLRLRRAEHGIRAHRDARGDDRCWRDDEELYKLLPEGYEAPAFDSCVELDRCWQFIHSRHNPTTVYVSPQRRIEALCRLQAFVAHDANCSGDEIECDCGLFAVLQAAGLKP
jgi:hypothetical protein